MPSVNDTLMSRGIRHAVFMEQLATGEVDHMVRFLDRSLWPDIRRTLDARLARVARSGGVRGAWTTQRYRDMLKILDGQIAGAMRLMSKDAATRLVRIGANEVAWARALLKESVPLTVDWNAPNLPLIRSIVSSRPFQGRLLREWYSGLDRTLRSAIREQVNIGLASGDSVPRIASRILGVKGIESAFTGASTRAALRRKVRAVVRTSTNHIAAQAREATYAANEDIIKAVRWVSALDDKTTDICMSLDGEEWPPGQGRRPPAHHQCRSTTVPVTKSWRELGIRNARDVRVGGRIFRNVQTGLNGHSPTRITYGDWLLGQPEAVQNQILGQRRASLLRSGRVEFKRFFSDGRRISLERLSELEGLPPPIAPAVAEIPPVPTALADMSPSELRMHMLEVHGAEIEEIAKSGKLTLARQVEVDAEFVKFNEMRFGKAGFQPPRADVEKARSSLLQLIEEKDRAEIAHFAKAEGLSKKLHRMMIESQGADGAIEFRMMDSQERVRLGDALKSLKPSAGFAEKAAEATKFLEGVWSGGSGSHRVSIGRLRKGRRAFANTNEVTGRNVAMLTERNEVKIFVHEIAHTIEDTQFRESAYRYLRWRARQATGGGSGANPWRVSSMRTVNSAFEMGHPDEFLTGYFGRVYNFSATEITSMYAEWLFADPATLMVLDAEGFEFIMATLRGVPVQQQRWFLALDDASRAYIMEPPMSILPESIGGISR